MNAISLDSEPFQPSFPADLAAFLSPQPAAREIGASPQQSIDQSRIIASAEAILQQGETLLNTVQISEYSRKVPMVFDASIGGHYRHCLDHFTSFVRAVGSEHVDYDARQRDARIETDPAFALRITRELQTALKRLQPAQLRCAVSSRCEVSYEHGNSPLTESSLGRELVYCIAHAIHHYALIAVMARIAGIRLPDGFGIAPSTVAHQKSAA